MPIIVFLRKDDNAMDNHIRKVTSTGRPLGEEEFIKNIESMIGRSIFTKGVGRPKKNRR